MKIRLFLILIAELILVLLTQLIGNKMPIGN